MVSLSLSWNGVTVITMWRINHGFQDTRGQAGAQILKLPKELDQCPPVKVLKHLAPVRCLYIIYKTSNVSDIQPENKHIKFKHNFSPFFKLIHKLYVYTVWSACVILYGLWIFFNENVMFHRLWWSCWCTQWTVD